MTLVPDLAALPVRAENDKVQNVTGVLLTGFDPLVDNPLTWGVDGVDLAEFTRIAAGLSPAYNTAAKLQMNTQAGFSTGIGNAVNNPANAFASVFNSANALGLGTDGEILAGTASITDPRRSRLYLIPDLSEWIEFRNVDVVHITFSKNTRLSPIGTTTVWFLEDAVVEHTNSRTARVFLQGRLANSLQQELLGIESGAVRDVLTRMLNVESENSYQSLGAPC